MYSGISLYATCPCCNTVPSSFSNIIVYCFFVASYVAVYVASPVTWLISGLQPANVYIYSSVSAFIGVSPVYSGIWPYATSLVCNTVPSSFANVIVYSSIPSGISTIVISLSVLFPATSSIIILYVPFSVIFMFSFIFFVSFSVVTFSSSPSFVILYFTIPILSFAFIFIAYSLFSKYISSHAVTIGAILSIFTIFITSCDTFPFFPYVLLVNLYIPSLSKLNIVSFVITSLVSSSPAIQASIFVSVFNIFASFSFSSILTLTAPLYQLFVPYCTPATSILGLDTTSFTPAFISPNTI